VPLRVNDRETTGESRDNDVLEERIALDFRNRSARAPEAEKSRAYMRCAQAGVAPGGGSALDGVTAIPAVSAMPTDTTPMTENALRNFIVRLSLQKTHCERKFIHAHIRTLHVSRLMNEVHAQIAVPIRNCFPDASGTRFEEATAVPSYQVSGAREEVAPIQ
jgi:hypothetical protein